MLKMLSEKEVIQRSQRRMVPQHNVPLDKATKASAAPIILFKPQPKTLFN